MSGRYGKMGIAALSLAVIGLVAVPHGAQAQDPPPANPGAGDTNDTKVISLDLEGTDIYYALTLLFKQAKANYTLDNSLKGILVTVHIKQPFKQALETVLKASGQPYTYQFENNVYSVVPIKEAVPDASIPTGVDGEKPDANDASGDIPVKLFVNNLNGLDIVAALGGKSQLYTSSYAGNVGYNPFAGQSGGGGTGGGFGGGGGGFGGGSGGFGGGGFGGGSGGFGGGGFGGGSGGFGGGGIGGGGGSRFGGGF